MSRIRRTQKQYAEDLTLNYVKGVKKSKVKSPVRRKTPEQLAKMQEGKRLRKEDFGQFLLNKIFKESESRRKKRGKKKANLATLETQPNLFNSYEEFLEVYPNEEACLKAFAATRLNSDGKLTCPNCRIETTVYKFKGAERFKCKACNKPYTITSGTVLHKCKIPMKKVFKLMYMESEFRNGLTVEKAAEIINIPVKTAFLILNKLRQYGFMQSLNIAADSVAVIDTMASGGNNINRKDHAKLTHKESLNRQKQVLVIKTKDGISRAIVLKSRDAEDITKIIQGIVGQGSTIHTDEGTEFMGIANVFRYTVPTETHSAPIQIKFNERIKYAGKDIPVIVKSKKMGEYNNMPVLVNSVYNHITANHSAGDHGQGDAESLNSILKQGIMYHCNCFTLDNFQLYLNFLVFHANYSHLTTCQRFMMVLKNLGTLQLESSNKPKQVRRRSTWLKLKKLEFAAKLQAANVKTETV